MKRSGYDRDSAGAVEATASTGGQLAPSVRGAGAFLMAEVLGGPLHRHRPGRRHPRHPLLFRGLYALRPACAQAGLHGLPQSELPRLVDLARRFYRLSPLVILIHMLLSGFSPFRAAAWGIALAILIMAAARCTDP